MKRSMQKVEEGSGNPGGIEKLSEHAETELGKSKPKWN